jgi:arylsulfatase A-like enzyme
VHLYDAHEHGPGGHIPAQSLEIMTADAERNEAELLAFFERNHGLTAPRLYGDVDRYDAQIHFADQQLRRLFDSLSARPLEGPTLWVVTSDHGEALGEHGYIGHGRFLYDEQLHVPLLMYGQGRPNRPARLTRPVRLVDLLPTVMELTGGPVTGEQLRLEGRSLAPLFRGEELDTPFDLSFAQRRPADERRRKLGWVDGDVISVQDPRFKYILNFEAEDEFYDRLTDPHEVRNLIGEDHPVKDELGAWLRRKYEALRSDRRPGGGVPQEIDERYIESLKALGYM